MNTMLACIPDWSERGHPTAIEKYIGNGWTYRGPGLYLSDTDTMLVVEERPASAKPYTGKTPGVINVLVWNTPLHDTIMGWTPPTVFDDRKL